MKHLGGITKEDYLLLKAFFMTHINCGGEERNVIPIHAKLDEAEMEITYLNPVEKKGHPRFHELLKQLGDLHASKGGDYGSKNDILANIRASEDFAVEPWRAVLVRINDKMNRLKTFARTGSLSHEGVTDTLLDIAAYCLLDIILFEESNSPSDPI